MAEAVGVNISAPKECLDKDIFIKVAKKKEAQPKVLNFRSFRLPVNSHSNIIIGEKQISSTVLFTLLKEHGLSSTLPMCVSLDPTTFSAFDWNPPAYFGPTVWYFKWNNIDCSLTSKGNYEPLYIRVHDMTPGLGEKLLDEIIAELLKHWKDPLPVQSLVIYTPVRTQQGYQWGSHSTRLRRDLDTVYIDPTIKQKLIGGLDKFYKSADLYDRYGVTWKRIHLFHGPPGSGKTSTVLAMASYYHKNVAKLTITPDLNSRDLERLFASIPTNTVVIIEDVDSLFIERTANTSVDFSTVLNCLDGIATARGLVLFMTTNHISKLDAAFIRPGRVDTVVEFKHPDIEVLRMALKTLGAKYEHEHEEYLRQNGKGLTIPLLQQHLFECIMEERSSILDK